MRALINQRSPSPVQPTSPVKIQAKLAVDARGDSSEQEADRVSEQVMRMPEPLLLESTGRHGVSSLSKVALNKVVVSEWFTEHTDWKRKGVSLAALGERAAGLTGVLSTYSEAVSLHPDLVDEAVDRIETRLQELEREVANTFSPSLKAPLEKEHRILESCLAKLLSEEGVPSFGMLAGVCSDLLRTPRR